MLSKEPPESDGAVEEINSLACAGLAETTASPLSDELPREVPENAQPLLSPLARARRAMEVTLLYALLPVPVLLQWVDIWTMGAVLFPVLIVIWGLHCREHKLRFFKNPYVIMGEELPPWQPVLLRMLLRFVVTAGLLVLLLAVYDVQRAGTESLFFSFAKSAPLAWLTVMCLYPLISVPLQEFPYRHIFFTRYAVLFPTRRAAFLCNALFFMWLHVPFLNNPLYGEVTLLLSFFAGLYFADTYMRGRRFWIVWLEHALYGNFIFTIGLGKLFYYNP